MNFQTWFQKEQPTISPSQAEAVIKLNSEGATLPFIARYRKEQTNNLDEVGIQIVIDAAEKWENIIKRQKFISEEIEKQEKLTPELKEKILSTFVLETLEDIYLPYKLKRKTKATIAKEAGLEPLAQWIWDLGHGLLKADQTLEVFATSFINEEKKIKDIAAALQGAQDILVERLSETQELRQFVRENTFKNGAIRSAKGSKAKPNSKFDNYFSFNESITHLLQAQNSHRYLAMRRGWMEEELSLSVGGKPDPQGGDSGFEEKLLKAFENAACTNPQSPGTEILMKAARLALKGYVQPSIESEVHKQLKEMADEAAIKVFAENVRKLLLASPYGPKSVLGVDPGIRTGCKLAVIDDSGKYIGNTVMHLQSESEKKAAQKGLEQLVKKAKIQAIAVGNGTAGRETESFIRTALKEVGLVHIPVVMVNESGASVYSASEVARKEFPDLDVTVRGAISIARRLQDPLAELVKIDPKSIGVGQYQHDVGEHALKKSLDLVVDTCVNQVGVNLNTSSEHLLSHVSGIGPGLAKSIVDYRNKKGLFKSREELLEVSRFSKKTFEQAAGFIRVPESENPLDHTGVHPERYPLLEALAHRLGKSVKELMGSGIDWIKKDTQFKKELDAFTFEDILKELEKPGRDPRDPFVTFHYRDDIMEVKDLKPDMLCPGIVTNVTNFGAFVDIGVHQDGLVHISQLSDKFVKDPSEVVSAGDHVQVRVLEINLEKHQIALSMKSEKSPQMNRPAQGPRTENRPSHSPPAKAPPPKAGAFNSPFGGLANLKNQLKVGK